MRPNAEVFSLGPQAVYIETVTSAADGSATLNIDAAAYEKKYRQKIEGRYFYGLITVPHTAGDAPTAWTATIDDKLGLRVLTVTTRSTTATEFLSGATTLGIFPPMLTDWVMTFAAVGDAKKVDVYLIFTPESSS